MTEDTASTVAATSAPRPKRTVGFLLGVGITFLPVIFSWFLLRKGYSTFARIVGFAWLVVVVVMVGQHRLEEGRAMGTGASVRTAQGDGIAHPSQAAQSITSEATSALAESTPLPPTSKWIYEGKFDSMRGAMTRFADLQSENELDFAFPYSGGAHVFIHLQDRAGQIGAMLVVEKGQFICNSLAEGTVAAKFDDGAIQHFTCAGTADGRTNVIFIHPAKRFVAALRKSHSALIEAQFFQEGSRQIDFETAGLKW